MILKTKKSLTLLLFLLAVSVQAQAVKESDLPANEKAQLTAAKMRPTKQIPLSNKWESIIKQPIATP